MIAKFEKADHYEVASMMTYKHLQEALKIIRRENGYVFNINGKFEVLQKLYGDIQSGVYKASPKDVYIKARAKKCVKCDQILPS